MVTQVEIARRVGLDVSSVNKILNQAAGPVFRKETIERVFRVAKRLGYNLNRVSKHSLLRENAQLKERIRVLTQELAAVTGKVGSVAIVLLVLRSMIGF